MSKRLLLFLVIGRTHSYSPEPTLSLDQSHKVLAAADVIHAQLNHIDQIRHVAHSLAIPEELPDYMANRTAVVDQVEADFKALLSNVFGAHSGISFIDKAWASTIHTGVNIMLKLMPKPSSYPELKPWFALNLRALNLAYTLVLAGTVLRNVAPQMDDDLIVMNTALFRIHQGLGRSNWARNLGLPGTTVNAVMWQNDALVGSLFSSDAINKNLNVSDDYCNLIQKEYTVLVEAGKQFGHQIPAWEPTDAMFDWCKLTGFNGLLVVTDWEQHLADYKGGYFKGGKYMEALVKHTLCHWTSLFALTKVVVNNEKPNLLELTKTIYSVLSNFESSFEQLQVASLALDGK